MVSLIATNIRNRRQHKVLCELFDKADTSGDGKVSLEEFVTMCDQYGVKLMEEEVEEFTTLSNKSGEVLKSDFISHLKKTNLSKQFETVSPECDAKWNTLAVTAFKIFDKNCDGYIDKKEFRWMTNSKRINQKTINLVYERSDLDGNGKLDFDEFKALIFRSKLRKDASSEGTCSIMSTSECTSTGMSTSTSATSDMSTSASMGTNTSASVSRSSSSKTASSTRSGASARSCKSSATEASTEITEAAGVSFRDERRQENIMEKKMPPKRKGKRLKQIKVGIKEMIEDPVTRLLSGGKKLKNNIVDIMDQKAR